MKMLLVNFPEIYCQGLVRLLQEMISDANVESIDTIAQAATELNFNRYDLVMMDPGEMVLEEPQNVGVIVAKAGTCPVIVVADNETPELLRNLKLHGVSGFVARSESADTVKRVVDAVLCRVPGARRGRSDQQTVQLPVVSAPIDEQSVPQRPSRLTPRQLQVLRSLAQGKPNKLIARDLDVSENTVKAHLKAVFRVLGARNRTEAVTRATQLRLIAY